MYVRTFFVVLSFSISFFVAAAPADSEKTIEWYQEAAVKGDADAQFNLGLIYEKGRVVPTDHVKAVEWYKKAVAQANPDAQNNLGELYFYGYGVERNYSKAFELYQKAAEQGHSDAQVNLGHLFLYGVLLPDSDGDYRDNVLIEQNFPKAMELFQKAAAQGNTAGHAYIARMYEDGHGVKQDYTKAKEWYLEAAALGSAHAQYDLGVLYERGRGVTKDDVQAFEWYQRAAAQGVSSAQTAVERLGKYLDCSKTAKTELFGVLLKCAIRDQFRIAIKNAGAVVKSEFSRQRGDFYDSAKVLKGSNELTVLYTSDGIFAQAIYTFPINPDANQILTIRNFLSSKYGEPDVEAGIVSEGPVTYRWYLEDGLVLAVYRDGLDTITYLGFTWMEKFQAVQDEVEQQKKAREVKEYSNQSNAF